MQAAVRNQSVDAYVIANAAELARKRHRTSSMRPTLERQLRAVRGGTLIHAALIPQAQALLTTQVQALLGAAPRASFLRTRAAQPCGGRLVTVRVRATHTRVKAAAQAGPASTAH